jgi:hypothetical protein
MHRLLPSTKRFGKATLTKQELGNGLIQLHMSVVFHNAKLHVEYLATNYEYRRFNTAIFNDMKRSLRKHTIKVGYTGFNVTENLV